MLSAASCLEHTQRLAGYANATLEGVGQGLLDGIEAFEKTGIRAHEMVLVGGGSRSNYWAQMLADIFNRPLVRREGGELGPALGAARLAQLGIDGGSVDDSFLTPTSLGEFLPNPATALLKYQNPNA
jgi:xylulokinase